MSKAKLKFGKFLELRTMLDSECPYCKKINEDDSYEYAEIEFVICSGCKQEYRVKLDETE